MLWCQNLQAKSKQNYRSFWYSWQISKKVRWCIVKNSRPKINCQPSFFCYNFLNIFRGSVIVWCPWWPNFLCLLSTGHCWSGNLTELGKRNILQICGFGVSFLWIGLFLDMREYIVVAILKTKVHSETLQASWISLKGVGSKNTKVGEV